MRKIISILIMGGMITGLAGCAGPSKKPERVKESELVWPRPPAPAKIKYVASYRGEADVGARSKFLDRLTGEASVEFARPQGVAVDRNGTLYVADSTLHWVFALDFEKKEFRKFGRSPEVSVVIPVGLAVDDENGLVLVASAGNDKVIAFDKESGDPKFVIDSPKFRNPVSVAVDPGRERIYITDSRLHELREYDYKGKFVRRIAGPGDDPDRNLYFPNQVWVDRDGKIYVADTFRFTIKVFSPEGEFLRRIGKGQGDAPGFFTKVNGVAVNSLGHIYALDTEFSNFQIFDKEGRLLLHVGEPGYGKPGLMAGPLHIFIDRNDRIYVADTFNRRIQVFEYLKGAGNEGG